MYGLLFWMLFLPSYFIYLNSLKNPNRFTKFNYDLIMFVLLKVIIEDSFEIYEMIQTG